ncbi:hypothetical protein AB0I93_27010 [Streptomyces sp. NPDC049967]|uniref:hypothetical protein n=1 Tax=Streptomyces sp. NPDC049967 TaxID=3155658 RepID=UPI00342D029F
MTGLIVRLLLCDGTDDGEVCDAELTAEDNVTSLTQLRTIAYRDHGWTTRRGDYCPRHRPAAQLPEVTA